MTRLYNCDFFKNENDIAVVLPRKPQPLFPEHSHEFNEIFIVESGYGIHEMNGKIYSLVPGTVFYINPTDHHQFGDVQNLNLVNLLYRHDQHFHFIKNIDQLLPSLDNPCWNITTKICLELVKILDNFSSCESIYQHQYEREFIFFDVMRLLRSSCFQEDTKKIPTSDKLKNLMTYLQSSYHLNIDWEALADRFNISYRTLQRHFYNQLGITPQKYLIYLRMMKAQEFLKHSNSSITEVAYKIGFNDSNYFSNVFTKVFGESPTQFRKKQREVN